MSEFDAQCATEHIDIVLDTPMADSYYSATHNLEILKAELLHRVAESALDISKVPWEIQQSCLRVFLFEDARHVSIFYLVLQRYKNYGDEFPMTSYSTDGH